MFCSYAQSAAYHRNKLLGPLNDRKRRELEFQVQQKEQFIQENRKLVAASEKRLKQISCKQNN